MTPNINSLLVTGLLACAWNAPAAEPANVATQTPPVRDAPSQVAVGDWTARPVESTKLGRLRGGSALSADVVLSGSTQGNTANNVSAGANSVSGGSFANASGLPVVIQNSGANVLIQNSTVVIILFRP